MKRTKSILSWLVGIIVGLYLMVTLLVNIHFVQRWLANGVEGILERVLDTEIEVGRIEIAWNGRLIVNDLQVWDKQGEEMLRVARVAARLGIRDLVNHRIRISNAQLFGMHANLYQECEECDPNFKFLIDAFASKDTTKHTPLDLRISQILVRRGNISWHQRWKPDTTAFTPAHLDLSDLDVTANLNALTDDSLNVRVKRFDVKEGRGLEVKSLAFNLIGNKQGGTLSDFKIELPNSQVEIPSLISSYRKQGSKWQLVDYAGKLKAHLSPTDFAPLLSHLNEVKDVADLEMAFQGKHDRLNIGSLFLNDGEGHLRLSASGRAEQLWQGKDSLRAIVDIWDLHAENEALKPYFSHEILERLGALDAKGRVEYAQGGVSGNIEANTPLGNALVIGNRQKNGQIEARLQSDGIELGELLKRNDIGHMAFDVKASGLIAKDLRLNLNGHISEAEYKGYRYRNVDVKRLNIANSKVDVNLASSDPNASFDAEGEIDMKSHIYKVKADIASLAPHMLNLTKRYPDTHFSGQLFADLSGSSFDNMKGVIQLNDFAMTDSTGTYHPGDIHLTSRPEGDDRNILLISPFLEAQVNGSFEPDVLVAQFKRLLSNYLPSVNYNPTAKLAQSQGHASFIVRAYNAEPLRRFLGVPLTLNGTTTAYGEMDSEQNALWVNLKSPGINYGNEQLRDVDLHLESNFESLVANLGLQRQMKGRWINVGADTQGHDGKLTTRLYFNNNVEGEERPQTSYAGDISIISRLWKDPEGKQGFESEIMPSNFIVSDTVWSIHPGFVSYYNGALQVDSFGISQGDRFIRVEGRASNSEADTLHAQLQRINLEYIFSLINFHAVELSGEATGDAYAHSLFSSPKADAYIRIPKFALNHGTMGDLDIHLNWGERPYSIFLDGDIADSPNQGRTLVKGYITPKKDVDYHGIDLNVNAERVNLEFINKWTSAIFDNLQGRATGWVHIFGPFKQINIEGDALVNEGNVGIPFIGVRYHMLNDSVQLRPDNIYFTDAHLYDPQGNPDVQGHQALVTGHLHHDSFKNLTYDINIKGQNILGYDFRELGDMNFYGTVLATGDVTLKGHPGQVRIGIKAHPERGTSFTYNATSPDKLTDTPFITYRSKSDLLYAKYKEENQSNAEGENTEEDQESSDLFIDFDLDIDENSTMNLLMDTRSGDKITLNGSGHMLAHYYNKGSFDLFGTYRVNRGTYNLSLQEIIHKNFEFSPDGTITFNGEPYAGDLNLQAVHTVSGVSLNDINPKANFSNTTTRVNCLMNIGGKARAPRITFDFDIPNANEEEKQMVRSLISTEEERNMQVIYLLGIGRFYAYDYANDQQTQGTMAMNSLLSSTLSGTINQALSNMIGSSNWNFGANLRTGQDGWNDLDVEGMLQGNLLNNRLLINGNFGYRDNPVATSNFIGDFDVKYLLTRSGSVALKAYSETNDRYFTKSSLTTQGIGVMLKKDFTSWKDIFTRQKRSKVRVTKAP